MIGLSNFTGATKDEKLKFAFMVFDEDGNGVITKQELVKILKANHMASSDNEVGRKRGRLMMSVRLSIYLSIHIYIYILSIYLFTYIYIF